MDLTNLTACEIYHEWEQKTNYIDRRSNLDKDEYLKRIQESSTLYIGGFSPYTSDQKIYEMF